MSDVISIKDIYRTLVGFRKLVFRKWILVISTVVIFAALGLVASFIQKPVYTAKLTFVLEETDSQGAIGGLAGIASQLGFSSFSSSSTFSRDNIVEILKSKNLLRKALLTENMINGKNELLINHYLRFSGYQKEWKGSRLQNLSFINSDESKLSVAHDSILGVVYREIIKKYLDVDKLKNQLDIIVIKTESDDEMFAKLFTENLIKSVTDFYIDTKTHHARATFEFLRKRADSTRLALDAAELQLARWQDTRNQLVKYEAQLDKSKLLRNVEILQVVYSEILKNLELSKMNLLNITPLVKIIDRPILPLDAFLYPPLILIIAASAFGLILILFYLFMCLIISEAINRK